jgi:hypothetical protein
MNINESKKNAYYNQKSITNGKSSGETKKVLKEGVLFTGDLREIFPQYYNKCLIPI